MNKQNRDRLIDTEIRLIVAGQSSASLRCGPWTSSITCELVRNAGSKAPPQPCRPRICISKSPWDLCRSSGGRFNVTSGKWLSPSGLHCPDQQSEGNNISFSGLLWASKEITPEEPGTYYCGAWYPLCSQRPSVTVGSGCSHGRKRNYSPYTCLRCGVPEGMTGRTRVWAHSYQAGIPSSHSACHSASPHSNTMMKVWPSQLYKEGNDSWGQIPFPRSTLTMFRKAWGFLTESQ